MKMSNIGTLNPVKNGSHEELHGEIKTLQLSVKLRFVPEYLKNKDQAPDYKIYATGMTGELTEIGAAWKKTKKVIGDADFEFLSITIDDPSFPTSLNVAAFKNGQGGWDVTWRRRQAGQSAAA
jgi:uncharacterized protein (DUF736 family)